MEEILEALNRTPGVLGSLVVGRDGLVIAAAGSAEPDPDRLGATTAEYFNTIEAGLTADLKGGNLDLVTLEASDRLLLLKGINDVTFLVVTAEASANLGLVRYETRAASRDLQEQL